MTKTTVAVVAFGWETPNFYRQWLGFDDPELVNEMVGASLNFGSPQSKHADAILDLVATVVLSDRNYVERLKRHYQLMRSAIDGPRKPKRTVKRIRRRSR